LRELKVKTALIKGGGSGIGRQLCRLVAEDAYPLVGFKLMQNELDDLALELQRDFPKIEKGPVQKDVAQDGPAEEMLAYCEQKNLSIDVLVNNAGFWVLWRPRRSRRQASRKYVKAQCGWFEPNVPSIW